MKKHDLKTLLTNWWSIIFNSGKVVKQQFSSFWAKYFASPRFKTYKIRKTRVALVASIVLLVLLGLFSYTKTYKKLKHWWRHRHRTEIRAFGIGVPKQYPLHGIDVSRHQGEIDWVRVAAMRDKGIQLKYVFLKATEGVSVTDSEFKTNWEAAKEQSLACGAYHFYRTHVFSGDQAKHFIKTVKLEKGDLPPVLDIEDLDGTKPEIMRKGIKNWLSIVEKHYKIQPIIYTNRDFFIQYLNTPEFKKYRLWLAHYYVSDLNLPDDRRWLFWQHSDKGAVNGIGERVDFNVFCCDTTTFKTILLK